MGHPNGTTKDENGFVQFMIQLNRIPAEVKGVVVYFKLYCKETKAEYQCTQIFDDQHPSIIRWYPFILPLKRCNEYKHIDFEYEIEILRIIKNNKITTEHTSNNILSGNHYQWNQEIEWREIKAIKRNLSKYTSFYHQAPFSPQSPICISFGSKKNNIYITLHLFKLPPKIEKIRILFEVNSNSKQTNIKFTKQ